MQLYQRLEQRIQSDDFTDILERERRRAATTPQPLSPRSLAGSEVLQADWWLLDKEREGDTLVTECTGDYVLIDHDDVINALATFIAAYIVALPEARHMKPADLQKAVKLTMKELRKGRVRRLLDWGKLLYRAAALSYGTFAAFTNPWVAEGVLRALWTCIRFLRAAF
jgi:hypothetical protein